MEYIKSVFDIIFPTKDMCYFCKSNEIRIENYICKSCMGKLDIVDKKVDLESSSIEKCYYSTVYDKFMKDIIKRFKFDDHSYLYKPLASLIYGTVSRNRLADEIDLIAFVPSHRRKEAVRGYNQSKLLAGWLSKELKIPILDGLVKHKYTKSQHFLEGKNRKDNLKDAFKLKKGVNISGKKILLVDDILTSGYTMSEVADCLVKNRAGTVVALALTSGRKI